MCETITVRLDNEVGRLLARVVKLSGRSQSDVVRDALRRQLTIDFFEQMRRRVAGTPVFEWGQPNGLLRYHRAA